MRDAKHSQYRVVKVYFRLMSMLMRDRFFTFCGFWFVLLVQAFLPAISILLLARLFSVGSAYLSGQAGWSEFATMAAVFAGVQLLEKFSTRLLHLWFVSSQRLLAGTLDKHIFAKMQRIRLEKLEQSTFYDQFARAYDVIHSGRFLNMLRRAASTIQEMIAAIAMIGAISYFSIWLVISLIIAALPIGILRLIRGRQFWQLHWFQSPKEREIGYLSGVLTGRDSAKEIRVFGINGYLMDRWLQLLQQVRDERWQFERKNVWREFLFSTATTEVFAYMLGVIIAIQAALTGQLELSGLAAALVALRTFQEKLRYTLIHAASATEGASYASDLFQFLDDSEEEREHSDEPIPILREGIRLDQVEFQYPGTDKPVFSDISCHIRPGERVAIVGVNGAGKTTLVKLILGLYKPTKGRVTYDGVDVQQLDPVKLREHLAVVMQDFIRYQYTVRDNIAFGDLSHADVDHAVRYAAVQSGVGEFVDNLKYGYDTRLGKEFPESTDLSGGQWQRMAMARGYMRDAQVLALDEPTSALDPLREAEVYRGFIEMGKGGISFIVSHRLASCRLADKIFVLDGHRLTEIGTHEKLMSMNGVYARMYKDQSEWYTVESR